LNLANIFVQKPTLQVKLIYKILQNNIIYSCKIIIDGFSFIGRSLEEMVDKNNPEFGENEK